LKSKLLVVLLFLVGCGGGNSSSTGNTSGNGGDTTPQSTVQAGQWEFTFPVPNSQYDAYMEVNLQATPASSSAPASFYAPSTAILGYANYFSSSIPPQDWAEVQGGGFPNGFISCTPDDEALQGQISSAGAITANVSSPNVDYGDLTSQMPSSSTTATYLTGNWSYSGTSPDYAPWLCQNGSFTSGTFTATYISPMNGTYTGTLQVSPEGSVTDDLVSLTITQNGSSASVTGTSAGPVGLGGTLSISSATVIGALMYGTATLTYQTGQASLNFGAHIHPNGNALDVVIVNVAEGQAMLGTLTN